MVEKEPSVPSQRPRVKQPPSVPFVWEVKPGMPKKDWKVETVSVNIVNPIPIAHPVKLVTSVPFDWEEKPGKPLPCLELQPEGEAPVLPLPPSKYGSFPCPSANSSLSTVCQKLSNDKDSSDDEDDKEKNEGVQEDMSQLDIETDESFDSLPSLLANSLLPSGTISSAISIDQHLVEGSSDSAENSHGGYETPSSPTSETGSTASSYATGSTSLVGAAFLECLFPLFSPDHGFLNKVHFHDKSTSLSQPNPTTELASERNCNCMERKTVTLGELILMSRRRSYQNRTNNVLTSKQNPRLDFMKFGCCMFGSGGKASYRRHHKQTLKITQADTENNAVGHNLV